VSSNESWTIGRLLQWTTGYLNEHGSGSGRLDAEVLLSHARKCERIELYTAFEQTPSATDLATFRDLVRRRAEGVPVAYLVGHREFYSLSFRVTQDVLIPRPETEFLVIAVLDLVKQRQVPAPNDQELTIADVGTGSGIIAICIAKQLATTRVWGIDISSKALEIAAANCQSHDVADRIELIQGDLLDALPAELRLDFVVSNPPYVSHAEFEELPSTVKDFEPKQALVAGPTGAETIGRLVDQASRHLKSDGWLLVEISPMIERRVHEIINANGQFDPPVSISDLAGLARVVQARRV
jgi:release factor glutamine methyltransferase